MKNMSKIVVAVAATAALAASAAYANGGGTPSGSVTATASANVVTPVTISQTTALSFGTFAANPTVAGTVDTSGNVTPTGSINVITPGTPAAFATSGVAGDSYTIVPPSNPVTLLGATTGATMAATLAFPSSPRTLNGSGADNFTVTGTLAVAAAQSIDSYSANYVVSVHY